MSGESSWGTIEYLGLINNAVSGAASGMARLPGSFRLFKSGKFSFKYYKSNWRGGSRARIRTRNSSRFGKSIGRYGLVVGGVMGIVNLREGYRQDGNKMGYNAYRSIATTFVGMGGSYLGGEIGSALGLYFSGYGAIPGGAVGSIAGGWAGEQLGGWAFDEIYYLLDEEYHIGWK